MYINKIFLFGNITRDPELRALPSGGQVCSFGLATNRVERHRAIRINPKFRRSSIYLNFYYLGRRPHKDCEASEIISHQVVKAYVEWSNH